MSKRKKVTVHGFKGFHADFSCRDIQYEVGKTYTIDGVPELCRRGFHFCEKLDDVLSYYPPWDDRVMQISRYACVQATDACVIRDGADGENPGKSVTNKLTIIREIDLIEELPQSKRAYSLEVDHDVGGYRLREGDPTKEEPTKEEELKPSFQGCTITVNDRSVIKDTYFGMAFGHSSIVRGDNTAVVYGADGYAKSGHVAIAIHIGMAEANYCAVAIEGLAVASAEEYRYYTRMGKPPIYGGGVAFGKYAEARSPHAVAIASFAARGVTGSMLVLVQTGTSNSGVSQVISARVDGKRIKENTWYRMKDGKLEEFLTPLA